MKYSTTAYLLALMFVLTMVSMIIHKNKWTNPYAACEELAASEKTACIESVNFGISGAGW